MDNELKTIAQVAFWNVANKVVGIAFWAIAGPFSFYFLAVGVFNKIVPQILRTGWFVEEIPGVPSPSSITIPVSTANLLIYVFVVWVLLYEFYLTSKDWPGTWEGIRVEIVLFLVVDMFVVIQTGLTRERLMGFLAFWLALMGISGCILLYKTLFSAPYEHG